MKRVKKGAKIVLYSVLGLLLIIIIASGINNRIGNCTVEGNISGLGTTVALVSGGTDTYDKKFFKLILIWNGKFSFKANLKKPGGGNIISYAMAFKRANAKPLWMRSNLISFHMDPDDHLSISGEKGPFSIDYLVKGNTYAEQLTAFRSQHIGILEEETKTYLELEDLRNNGGGKGKIDSLQSRYQRSSALYRQKKLEYVKAHPNHEVAAKFLNEQEKDSIIRYYPMLSAQVLRTPMGEILGRRMQAWSTVAIGKPAPMFRSKTVKGEGLSLASFKGKYVVLDFWGTWCAPCVSGIAKMKAYFEKYNEKVAFVGIACRDTKVAVLEMMKDKEMRWPQILNEQGPEDLSFKYAIDVYPTKILINPNGELVKVFKSESEDFYKGLDDILGKKK